MAEKKRSVVVVTGASAGVGRAAVRAFARRGCDVGLIARGRDGLEAAKAEVEAVGGRAVYVCADVSHADEVEAAAEFIEGALGPIDVWVNDAMVTVFSPVIQTTPEEYRRVTEVDYLGFVYGTLAALKRMRSRDSGTIVQVGSALAYRSIPLQSAYCAAKHAIEGFTESLRTELMHDHSRVRVTMVQLPALNTPQFGWNLTRMPHKPQPVPPIYQPEVAAEAIVWAAFHKRRELLVGWTSVAAIWGNKFFPSLLDRRLARTGYDSQQYDGPVEPGRRVNVWQPVPGDAGAHGAFDSRAHEHCPQLWLTTHKSWLAAATAGMAAFAFFRGR